MAAAGSSPSAPSRPGAGVAMTAAGWRDCGDGAVVGLSAATAVGLSTAPATGDGVAISGRPASRSGRGDRRQARLTPAPLGRRRVAGDGHLRCGFVGDDGIGSVVAPPASGALGGARSSTGCRVDPGRGQQACCGTALPSPSLLFLQIRFSPSSVVVLLVLTGGVAPAPLFLGAPPFLG
uniref:Uncharacterized protein n=1 Tax=Oryza rufipogon TaxID=4529 RepID=A0A0E0NFA4_ORYRU